MTRYLIEAVVGRYSGKTSWLWISFFSPLTFHQCSSRQEVGAGDGRYWTGSNKILLVAALKDITENMGPHVRLWGLQKLTDSVSVCHKVWEMFPLNATKKEQMRLKGGGGEGKMWRGVFNCIWIKKWSSDCAVGCGWIRCHQTKSLCRYYPDEWESPNSSL